MTAYVVIDIKVADPAKMQEYRDLSTIAVSRHGGRYLARGGKTEVIEGDWQPERLVIIEFPSLQAAHSFYDSPEYVAARKARAGAAHFDMLVIEGYAA